MHRADADLMRIRRQAVSDLMLSPEKNQDDFLYSHGHALARIALQLAAQPYAQSLTLDVVVLYAAALYCDAGWVRAVRDGHVSAMKVLVDAAPANLRAFSVEILRAGLKGVVDGNRLEAIASTVLVQDTPLMEAAEAELLHDARYVYECSISTFHLALRRAMAEGKGVEQVIHTWRRREDFGYFEALLSNRFIYDANRQVALVKLTAYRSFMRQLAAEYEE